MDVGQAEPGPARGVGEHAHRAARLQRHHRQDDGRLRPRRPAVDHVHGAVRPRRRRRARTTTRSRRRTTSSRARPRRRFDGAALRRSGRATSPGPASAACTASATSATGRCAGWRPSRRSRRAGTRTGSPATGTTCRTGSVTRVRHDATSDCSWSAARPGIGRRSPARYADRGWSVVLTGRDAERGRRGRAPRSAAMSRGIAARPGASRTTIAGALADVGRARPPRDRGDRPRRQHRRATTTSTRPRYLVTLKLVGYTEVVHTLLPRLSDDASIVLFGGLARDRPYPGSTTVSTVNGGVGGLVHTLAAELAPDPGQRAAPGHRRRQPVLVGQGRRRSRRSRPRTPTRPQRRDGRHRRRRRLPAAQPLGQRHRARHRRRAGWLTMRVAVVGHRAGWARRWRAGSRRSRPRADRLQPHRPQRRSRGRRRARARPSRHCARGGCERLTSCSCRWPTTRRSLATYRGADGLLAGLAPVPSCATPAPSTRRPSRSLPAACARTRRLAARHSGLRQRASSSRPASSR